MLRNFAGRRLYSSASNGGVTNEFLQHILARAQEATSAKAQASRMNQANRERRRNNVAGSSKGDFNGRNRNRDSRFSKSKADSSTIFTKTKQGQTDTLIKQQQFKKKTSDTEFDVTLFENEQLLDKYSNTERKLKNYAKSARSQRSTSSQTKRKSPGLSAQRQKKRESTAVPRINKAKAAASTAYVPQSITLHSLIKDQPLLSHSINSRLVSYGLKTLTDNEYPLNTSINEGFDGKNVSLTTSYAENYGSYTGGNSLILQKEKLFKNLSVSADESLFEEKVLGKYNILPTFSGKDFSAIAKNDKKISDLEKNSEIVKTSLNNNNTIPPDAKALLLEVCSGIKPVSELTN